ncbi:uncharacterized protein METZ01_LOCUS486301, partial [marine metagenome]
MKKKLLKLAIIFFILFEGNNFIYANEKIILPEKKPIISKEQTSKKIENYLIPLEKPTSKLEKTKPKKIKKLIVSGEIIPRSKPLVVKTKKSVRAKKSKYYSKKDYEIAKISIRSMEK